MDESRKQFERWINSLPMCSAERHRIDNDRYRFNTTEVAWKAWRASREAIEIDVEKLKIELENLECSQICLDEAEVPRKEGSEELSMWGRIVRYAAGIKVKE